jgi:hypothetical protein
LFVFDFCSFYDDNNYVCKECQIFHASVLVSKEGGVKALDGRQKETSRERKKQIEVTQEFDELGERLTDK